MKFCFRYVPFGTAFELSDDLRHCGLKENQKTLYRNELAVDVGGDCYGHQGSVKMVFDHHFHRADGWNFPAAAVAVIHHAEKIRDRFEAFEEIWIVTHSSPDFDALCSIYLARKIIERAFCVQSFAGLGISPGAWLPIAGNDGQVRKINWFDPDLKTIPWQDRWPYYLAACACRADNTRSFQCAREHSLPSVLYAAIYRGNDIDNDTSTFFDHATERIKEGRNPLVDAIFDSDGIFALEVALLKLDFQRYEEDLRKARRCIVNIPHSNQPFEDWFEKLEPSIEGKSGQPLVLPDQTLNPAHLNAWIQDSNADTFNDPNYSKAAANKNFASKYAQVEGVFIRDPQSILFKDWARADTSNTLLGTGFQFTCIARSNSIIAAKGENCSRYWIALDMERSSGQHLYSIWAELQYEELRRTPILINDGAKTVMPVESSEDSLLVVAATKEISQKPARRSFEARSLATDDPWFDGHNYRATILDTPTRGTLFKEGILSDLSDDEVASLVYRKLREPFYRSFTTGEPAVVLIEDFETSLNSQPRYPKLSTENWRLMMGEPSASCHSAELNTFAQSNLRRLSDAVQLELSDSTFRFAAVSLGEGANLNLPGISEQIARELWPILEPEGVHTVPSDFIQNHYHRTSELIVLWNRRGIVVGFRAGHVALALTDRYRSHLMEMASCGREIEVFLAKNSQNSKAEAMDAEYSLGSAKESLSQKTLQEGKCLLNRLTSLKLILQAQELRALGKLFDACRFDQVVSALHAVNQEEANRLQAIRREEAAEREKTFERLLTIFVFGLGFPTLAMALLQAFGALYNLAEKEPALRIGLNADFLGFLISHPFVAFLMVATLLLPFLIAIAIWAIVHQYMRRKEHKKNSFS